MGDLERPNNSSEQEDFNNNAKPSDARNSTGETIADRGEGVPTVLPEHGDTDTDSDTNTNTNTNTNSAGDDRGSTEPRA